jgi:hypothetical protein
MIAVFVYSASVIKSLFQHFGGMLYLHLKITTSGSVKVEVIAKKEYVSYI